MLWNQLAQEAPQIGWDFYGPVLLFVLMIGLGVPVWSAIGAAAMLSRAVGGIRGKSVILTMPGSPAAVDLSMEKIVLAELPHLVQQARS